MLNSLVSRRSFLKSASLAVSSAGTFVLPARVFGANDRINFAIIGCGGMGSGHLERLVERRKSDNIDIPAVCDVYRRRLTRAMETSGGEGTLDYREILDRNDIDAILIATPDHWHSKIAIDAMESGKHVYCEKPMTLTVEQAIEVRNAVKRYDKVFQVGPNSTSEDQFWVAQRLIREGRIGKVTWAQGSYNRNVRGGAFNRWFLIDETASPYAEGDDYIDWDMWLGHEWSLAPRIPWNPEHFFRFRKYWPYNGGVATDLLYHRLAPLLLAIIGENGEYPQRVTAAGGLYILKDGRDIPDVFMMNVDYPEEFTVSLTSILTNNTQVPTRIYGQYGTLDLDGEPFLRGNGDYMQEFMDMNDGYEQVRMPANEIPDPYSALQQNFTDVIRNGGRLLCNVDLGCATMVAIKMGVEAYRQNKVMRWDAESEQII